MRIRAALTVFCCLLQGSPAQVDISGCCTHVKIETTGEASTHQGNRIGEYRLTGVLADRPIYKNVERDEFLFYLQSNKKGLWMVGPTAGQFNGGLAHRGDTYCVEDVRANQWKYTDGSAWHVDSHLRVSCLDETVTPQCLYNDQTEFVGGDLPEVFGGGGVETSMESSADCIEECEKRSGCKYWTWVMGEKVNCFLKNSKVEMVRKPKYVSGSIPQACTSTPSTPTQAPSTYSVCTYNNLDFQGGDLFTVLAFDVDDCRKQCEEHVSCQLFTYDKNLERGCYFKTDQVTVSSNDEVVSGATSEICEDFILPHVTKKNDEPVYNENEVNGKFKITSLRWDEKLNDPSSQEYLDLSNTIEDSIESMLRSERDLDEQAEFTVKVQKFKKGSVVCDFKVNYILKEAYVAIPFAIKPSNISDAMSKNFKFKKGILFQRFLIAAGSFNSSAPVDHCAAKGCSHKCDYDYDVEDYLCTCPRTLVLDSAGKTCITPEEAATEKSADDTTDASIGETSSDEKEPEEEATTQLPEVKLTLLPSDCLWSPWSDWTPCSSSCGEGKMERQRSVVLPEKNGGACPGRFKEVVECSSECNEETEEDNTTTESSILVKDGDDEQTTTSSIGEESEDAADDDTTTESVAEKDEDIEDTVTEAESKTTQEEGSGITTLDEQTTVPNIAEEVITVLPNDVKPVGEDDSDKDEMAETTTMKAEENVTKDDVKLNAIDEQTTEIGDNIQETTTSYSKQDDTTTLSGEEVELDDAFGRKITTDASTMPDEIAGITIGVTDLETITESATDTMDDEKEIEGSGNDEDTKIIFPLNEDVEIISVTTTKSPDTTEMPTQQDEAKQDNEEMKSETESPSTSVDMVNEDAIEQTTSASEETVSQDGEQDNTTDELEITTQMQEVEAETIPTNNDGEDIDGESATPGSESTTEIPYEADTEMAIDNEDNVENRSESPDTTMKDQSSDKKDEYETTTHIGMDADDDKLNNQTPSTESATDVTKDEGEDIIDSQTTLSPDIVEDIDDAAQTIGKEPETEESGSDATTVEDTTGEDEVTVGPTVEGEVTEKNLDKETMSVDKVEDSEKTTTLSSALPEDAPTKAPRFDIENELNEGDTTPTPEVDNMTITAELTTLNPLVDDTESTTVAIISIEETDEDVTIVTTAKPYIPADDEDTENTNEQETTTSENIIEDATEPQLEVETTMDEETSNDAITTRVPSEEEKEDTTTPRSEYENPDQEFLCKESFKSDENSDIPLECILTNGEDERTVLIVIPGDSLGGDRNKLFNKNVKIVVKDFMVMERGPRTLS